MGRQAYLTTLAWGRSAWARPDENGWLLHDDIYAPLRPVAPLENQYQNNIQEYNDRLHPVNLRSRDLGRSLRSAANDVLSVVGVVERYDALKSSPGVTEEENSIAFPIALVAEATHAAVSWWAGNLSARLLVFPPDSTQSFVEVVVSHYQALGPYSFFFAGFPSSLVAAVIAPDLWTGPITYLLTRVVLAVSKSSRVREHFAKTMLFSKQLIHFSLDLFQLPFLLHAALQQVGVLPASLLLPEVSSLIPFTGTSIIRIGSTPLPILTYIAYRAFFYASHATLSQLITPLIVSPKMASWPRRNSSFRKRGISHSSSDTIFAQAQRGITQFVGETLSILRWGYPRPLNTLAAEESGGSPLVRQDPSIDVNTPNLVPPTTSPVLEDIGLGSTLARQGQEEGLVPAHPANSLLPPMPTMNQGQPSASSNLAESGTLDESHSSDEAEEGSVHDATIRISSIDSTSGTINLHLEIGVPVSEEVQEEHMAAHVHGEERHDSLGTENSVLRKRKYRVSNLSTEPAELLGTWLSGCITGVLFLPLHAIVHRRLAAYYVERSGLSGSIPTFALGLGASSIASAQAFPRSSLGLMANYSSKVGLCLLIEGLLGMGVWRLHCSLINWVGKKRFGWGNL